VSKRIFKPKITEGREWERWQLDVSQQLDAGQPLSDNEMMTYMLSYENKPAVTLQDLQDVRTAAEMITPDATTARQALSKANDAALLAYMGGW
jgi:hypothetical protein